jgi:two-component system, NtrC family, response regulator GlrR
MGGRDTKTTSIVNAGGSSQLLVQSFGLRVIAGPDRDAVHASTGERTSIGTHSAMDFVLHDPAMSRFHCEIVIDQGRAVVRDLGSRNGTLVDGVAVLGAPLNHGATLGLGETQIRFDLGKEQLAIPLSAETRFGSLIGHSVRMRAVIAVLERAAACDATLLLQGETGTGKDAAATSVHARSGRRAGPFVVVDCSSIPAGLIESELFGHERGAFTGAHSTRPGAFELASGGTLFLDEVGELRLDLQPRLLRVMDSRRVQRVGGRARIPVDVRVIAASNRNLRREVNSRRFRADLYYRLAVLELVLPPLRERLEDLPALVEDLVVKLGAEGHPGVSRLRSPAFVAELRQHSWSGNVRELRNYLERCLALETLQPMGPAAPGLVGLGIDLDVPLRAARARWVRSFEQQYLLGLLRLHGNNVSAAARAAGVDRAHLHRLLARAGIGQRAARGDVDEG